MRSTVRRGLIGAGIGLLSVVAFGAIRGAIFGNGDDYALNRTGLDGAFIGAILFAVFGGLPAVVVGAGVGVVVGMMSRNRKAAPPNAEPNAAADGGA